jgi:hypothetical protein
MILQHHLPKRYALLEFKPSKRGHGGGGSAVKLAPEEVLSIFIVEFIKGIGQCRKYRA